MEIPVLDHHHHHHHCSRCKCISFPSCLCICLLTRSLETFRLSWMQTAYYSTVSWQIPCIAVSSASFHHISILILRNKANIKACVFQGGVRSMFGPFHDLSDLESGGSQVHVIYLLRPFSGLFIVIMEFSLLLLSSLASFAEGSCFALPHPSFLRNCLSKARSGIIALPLMLRSLSHHHPPKLRNCSFCFLFALPQCCVIRHAFHTVVGLVTISALLFLVPSSYLCGNAAPGTRQPPENDAMVSILQSSLKMSIRVSDPQQQHLFAYNRGNSHTTPSTFLWTERR